MNTPIPNAQSNKYKRSTDSECYELHEIPTIKFVLEPYRYGVIVTILDEKERVMCRIPTSASQKSLTDWLWAWLVKKWPDLLPAKKEPPV